MTRYRKSLLPFGLSRPANLASFAGFAFVTGLQLLRMVAVVLFPAFFRAGSSGRGKMTVYVIRAASMLKLCPWSGPTKLPIIKRYSVENGFGAIAPVGLANPNRRRISQMINQSWKGRA